MDQAFYALVKREYRTWLNNELAMERAPTKAAKILKAMACMRTVSSNAIISCWNKSRGIEHQTPDEIDEDDELITLELEELEPENESDVCVVVNETESPPDQGPESRAHKPRRMRQSSIKNYFGCKTEF